MITPEGWQSFSHHKIATGENQEYWIKTRRLSLEETDQVRDLFMRGLTLREAGLKEAARRLWNRLRRPTAAWGW